MGFAGQELCPFLHLINVYRAPSEMHAWRWALTQHTRHSQSTHGLHSTHRKYTHTANNTPSHNTHRKVTQLTTYTKPRTHTTHTRQTQYLPRTTHVLTQHTHPSLRAEMFSRFTLKPPGQRCRLMGPSHQAKYAHMEVVNGTKALRPGWGGGGGSRVRHFRTTLGGPKFPQAPPAGSEEGFMTMRAVYNQELGVCSHDVISLRCSRLCSCRAERATWHQVYLCVSQHLVLQ